MPDYIKISELPAASSVAATDQIELNQAGTSRRGTVAQFTAGMPVQVVTTQGGAVATGATIMPYDDTIPQQTEGDLFMSLAITPKSATSKLIITVTAFVAHNVATAGITGALFQDSTAGALAVGLYNMQVAGTANIAGLLHFAHTMTSGTTSATTFKFRAGGNTAGITTFNGSSAARLFGGVLASSIVIQEVL